MAATILAVDDSISVRKMVEFTLKSRGHRVVTAGDGEEALATLECDTFDLVVLDINMPRLDGLALLECIRAHETWRALPVLMLTTQGQDADRDRALALGATGYMMKPFQPSELLRQVAALTAG